MKITRDQFVEAIEAGIKSSEHLTITEKANLRAVGRHATSFGNNFSTGCPATLAGVPRMSDGSKSAMRFAFGFDDAVAKFGESYFEYAHSRTVSVIDE